MKPAWEADGAVWLYRGDALEVMKGMEADSVNLVCGSPPYLFCRSYGFSGKQWWGDYETWIETMLAMVTEAARVCDGPVVVVAANPTRKRSYYPAVEALMVRWFERGGDCQLYRPVFWHRVGIPGSGQNDGFRADVEYCCVFKRPGELPWSDNTACGKQCRYPVGGKMSNRTHDGRKRNAKTEKRLLRKGGMRRANGEARQHGYTKPEFANPGNYIETHEVAHVNVGGGAMGSKLAHENEAPYPEVLCERFIRSWSPEGGVVLDPWMGSGTTLAVAVKYGRRAVGIDVRESQVKLARKRIKAELNRHPLFKAQ